MIDQTLRITALERQVSGLRADLAAALAIARRAELAAQLAAGAGGGGGGSLLVGTVAAPILAGGIGMVDLCDSSAGWAYTGGYVTVQNPDPVAAIPSGSRVAVQADQSGTLLASPLQC